jgi:predicted thioesterase
LLVTGEVAINFLVGEGTHERFIVAVARFAARVQAKAAGQ